MLSKTKRLTSQRANRAIAGLSALIRMVWHRRQSIQPRSAAHSRIFDLSVDATSRLLLQERKIPPRHQRGSCVQSTSAAESCRFRQDTEGIIPANEIVDCHLCAMSEETGRLTRKHVAIAAFGFRQIVKIRSMVAISIS